MRLGFEEDDGVVGLDRADQQTLRVIGIRGHDDLDACDECVKIASGDCECVWPPRMPPPQGVRIVTGEKKLAGAAIADPRQLTDDLVETGVDVIGELDLGDRGAVRSGPCRWPRR